MGNPKAVSLKFYRFSEFDGICSGTPIHPLNRTWSVQMSGRIWENYPLERSGSRFQRSNGSPDFVCRSYADHIHLFRFLVEGALFSLQKIKKHLFRIFFWLNAFEMFNNIGRSYFEGISRCNCKTDKLVVTARVL